MMSKNFKRHNPVYLSHILNIFLRVFLKAFTKLSIRHDIDIRQSIVSVLFQTSVFFHQVSQK